MGNEHENLGIGKEQPKIEAKPVTVIGYEEVEVKKDEKVIGNKLVLKVKHPDVEELELSKVKYQKGEALKESGLWLHKDKDGAIPYNSALASLLRHNNCSKIADLKDKEIQTTADANGYCIAKAY
ncbi:hypothetical protein LCGC14_0884720 [marine sediment metagenome]|uniref:Uncharacterized protein n=1 Tax=marine sediment metagenome TaxID=412755 RepID=A0A0F9P0X7_9ZZZZ